MPMSAQRADVGPGTDAVWSPLPASQARPAGTLQKQMPIGRARARGDVYGHGRHGATRRRRALAARMSHGIGLTWGRGYLRSGTVEVRHSRSGGEQHVLRPRYDRPDRDHELTIRIEWGELV
jgi:hypothetical protein